MEHNSKDKHATSKSPSSLGLALLGLCQCCEKSRSGDDGGQAGAAVGGGQVGGAAGAGHRGRCRDNRIWKRRGW